MTDPICEEGDLAYEPWQTLPDGSQVGGAIRTCVGGEYVITTESSTIPAPDLGPDDVVIAEPD